MKHISHSFAEQEHRLLHEAPMSSPETQGEHLHEEKHLPQTPDALKKETDARIKQAGSQAQKEVNRVLEMRNNADMRTAMGQAGGAALEKAQNAFTRISTLAHEARQRAQEGSLTERAATGMRDLTERGGRGVGDMRTKVEGWTQEQAQQRDAAQKEIDSVKQTIAQDEKQPAAPAAQAAPTATPEAKPAIPAPQSEQAPPAAGGEKTSTAAPTTAPNAPAAAPNTPTVAPASAPQTPAATEKPANTPTATPEGQQTNHEALRGRLDAISKRLNESKDGKEKFTAFVELIAVAVEYIQRAFNGTLDQKTEKTPTPAKENAPTTAPEGTEKTENLTFEQATERKQKAITENGERIRNCDTQTTELTKTNEALTKSKETLQQRRAELAKDQTVNAQQLTEIDQQITNIAKIIEGNNARITALKQQKETYQKQLDRAQSEIRLLTAIQRSLSDVEGTNTRITLNAVTGDLLQVSSEMKSGDRADAKLTFERDAAGNIQAMQLRIEVDNKTQFELTSVPPELRSKMISNDAHSATFRIQIQNTPQKSLAGQSVEPTTPQPSATEQTKRS